MYYGTSTGATDTNITLDMSRITDIEPDSVDQMSPIVRSTNSGGSELSELRSQLWEAGYTSAEINDLTRQGLPAMRSALAEDSTDTTMIWVAAGIGAVVLAGLLYLAVKG